MGGWPGSRPPEILQETGWARSVGGVGPYLTLFARAGTSRAAADAAVAALQIHEIPAARGCTYVVPGNDFALALQVGGSCADGEMKVANKLGVTDKEIDKLSDAVLKALEAGPLDPEEIRTATGKASRSLGEEGKKKGLTTTLPLSLGRLQASGVIRRVPVNGRLDQQRYAYTLWRPNPIGKNKLTADELNSEIARRYFGWIGPATAAEFQWFSGLGVKAAKAAMEPLRLEETGEAGFLLPEHRDAFESFQAPRAPQYILASSLDGLSLLRRDLKGMLDPRDRERQVYGDRGMVPLSGVADLRESSDPGSRARGGSLGVRHGDGIDRLPPLRSPEQGSGEGGSADGGVRPHRPRRCPVLQPR